MKIAIASIRMCKGYGVDVVIHNQAIRLSKAGHKVTVFTFDHDQEYYNSLNYKIIKVSNEYKLLKLIKNRFDIVIAHSSPFFEILPVLTPYVFTIAYEHGDPDPNFFPLQEKEERLAIKLNKYKSIYPAINAVIGISNFICKDIMWPEAKCIYNGIDHLIPQNKIDNIYLNYNVKKNDLVILCVARLGIGENHYKGIDTAIDFWTYLSSFKRNIKFFVLGKGNDEDKTFLTEKGIDIILNATNDELISAYKNCHLLVSFSKWEGFNLPIAEATYFNKPALAINTSCHSEVTPLVFDDCIEMADYILNSYPKQINEDAIKCKDKIGWSTWDRNIQCLIDFIQNNYIKPKPKKTNVLSRFLSKKSKQGNLFLTKHSIKPLQTKKFIGANTSISKIFPIKRKEIDTNANYTKKMVSICILTKNKLNLIKPCIESILTVTDNTCNYEIIIGDTGTDDKTVLDYYKSLGSKVTIRYLNYYNFSQNNNFIAKYAKGEFLLFLNNDTKIIDKNWINALLEPMLFDRVGVVGTKLLFADGLIQHAGSEIFTREPYRFIGWHPYAKYQSDFPPANVVLQMPSVTGACLLMRHFLFDYLGGFDPLYDEECQDADLCLQVREQGYKVIYYPKTYLYHFENGTREIAESTKDRIFFRKKWQLYIESTIFSKDKQSFSWNPLICVIVDNENILLKNQIAEHFSFIATCFSNSEVTIKGINTFTNPILHAFFNNNFKSFRFIPITYEDNYQYDHIYNLTTSNTVDGLL